ncbi:MAG: chromate transporter [Peptococcaceae bacterium]|jgi:chromate transporter|nr:chromate transporter [Peptococcaceae bacterium]
MIYLQLIYEFFKTGLFAIGGGLATIPFLSSIADRYPWFDQAMLANMIAISESTPGPIGINTATYAGYQAAGVPGSIVATFSLVAPSVIVIVLIVKALNQFDRNLYVRSAFAGLRPAVIGLIGMAWFSVFKIAVLTWDKYVLTWSWADLFDWKAVVIFLAVLFTMWRFDKHPLVYIAASAAAGILLKL